VSPKQVVVIVDGGILSAIRRVFTRYSANDPQFPVNDWSLFTGKLGAGAPGEEGHQGKAVAGRVSGVNGPADGENATAIRRFAGHRRESFFDGRLADYT
jgi:hypothetical protein